MKIKSRLISTCIFKERWVGNHLHTKEYKEFGVRDEEYKAILMSPLTEIYREELEEQPKKTKRGKK
jgi:hypothetical protein